MNTETLIALQGSIKKWEAIVDGTYGDKGYVNCPLCTMFLHNGCIGCPVSKKVSSNRCTYTPYETWIRLKWNPSTITDMDTGRMVKDMLDPIKAKEIAQEEVDFLKGLLPNA